MAFILRRPGTEVSEDLADTGLTVTYRIPDAQSAGEMRRAALMGAKNLDRIDESMRVCLGAVMVSLDGVENNGEGSVYTFETDKRGRLTEDSLAVVLPISQQLMAVALRLIGLSVDDRKNF